MRTRKTCLLLVLLMAVLSGWSKSWKAEEVTMAHLADARRYVCDPDGILSQGDRDSIDSYLLRLDKECGVETAFVIVRRVANGDTFRFAEDLGNRHGVGDKKTNRGLVVVVAVDDHRYFIAPGEGLEKDLTDLECDEIGRACIVANMKANRPGKAMLTTAKAVYKKFKTGSTGLPKKDLDDPLGAWIGLGVVLLSIALVYLGIRNSNNSGGKNGGKSGGKGSGGPGGFIIWGNPGHLNDRGSGFGGGFGGGSFGGGSFGGGGAGGGW